MLSKQLIQAASGSAGGGGALGIEDIFSTWLYTGTGSTQTITNGIDLAGEGGLVWTKCRSDVRSNALVDTIRGGNSVLISNSANAESVNPYHTFLDDGYTVPTYSNWNALNNTYASWTFRKAPGFFDVVTYTGNGVAGRTIAHNLGSAPGCIIVKRTDVTAPWAVYHRSLTYTDPTPTTYPAESCWLSLDTNNSVTNSSMWGNTAPTNSVFSVGSGSYTNTNGATYVAYLFAHDEQIFGESGDQSVIKCGSYTGNGSTTGPTVTLGWEPQWLLIKRSSAVADWVLIDNMRGFSYTSNEWLAPNTSAAASTTSAPVVPLPTGFQPQTSGTDVNGSGSTYIYIAIRRGPMKTPTSGTEVFNLVNLPSGNTNIGFVPDLHFAKFASVQDWYWYSRLTGGAASLSSNSTRGEDSGWTIEWDANSETLAGSVGFNGSYMTYQMGRAPGFFDVVAYTGTGSARTVSHNLGVAPELMIVKQRNGANNWPVYSGFLANNQLLLLNSGNSAGTFNLLWNNTSPTASVFSVGTDSYVNGNTSTYIAYLFATCPGISKVGSYTGTGTTLDIDCGFTAGARFVLIKRTDSTGDWYVWDTARGIVSGNDPYLLLNSTAAEVTSTDYIDPLSSGFQISSTAPAAINANGGSYIFLAIA